ncbi:cbb3-type cytochrome oxidase subunit 3 [endosymbiont of unidentified scaly snail isolate Monju]|uniref:cbb3-type cytochrome oxidase subunit 3 n=1 Tax=endosymbiont of unidentified scaly snail isolate Monju TaxID=1248727 RepID=UPI00038924CA|nr:cbb3-type cytochrome c oxidase subunit 3 [endosymbiont of unidentified scaly snail isolate Monju]BAN68236.1 cytochrome c oxidase, cbb3-type, subunit [endosymbiont of unidentified scaly snail isolate Monju]
MFEWLSHMENTKPLALVIFFVTFVGILLYVFSGRKRAKRLESYKNIPFLDDEKETSDRAGKVADKDQDNG